VCSEYQRLVVASFKAEAGLLRELDEVARRLGVSKSEVIRRAVARFVRYYVEPTVTPRMTLHVVHARADGGAGDSSPPRPRRIRFIG
jgi:metal-responsive CopG/Arc/MetJ family transcriptional regulator